MKLIELLKNIEYTVANGNVNVDVLSITNDSRKASNGSLFFCISGNVVDGHDFASTVSSKGAAVIIAEKDIDVQGDICVIKVENTRYAMGMISSAFYGNPSKKLKVIGITGTKGKTTTTYMIQSMLLSAGYKTGLIGTIETIINNQSIKASNTTPESIVLQKMLRDMVDAGLDSVVMEVSSQGLMLDRVAGVDFDYGIFTNLSEDHIGPAEHKTFDEYLMWKSKLFTMCKVGIFNIDDKYVNRILENHSCKVVTYGLNSQADYKAEGLQLYSSKGRLGISYKLQGKYNEDILVNMPGEFSVHNSLAAIAIADMLNVKMDIIKKNLENIKVKGRVELVDISNEFTVLIDYAHNAVSLFSILETLRAYKPNRLISVFGCGGNRSKTRRYEMGQVSGDMADLTIITSDNPRYEEPQDIIEDIKTGINKTEGKYIEIIDRKEAFRYAILNAKSGDIIVLAGKGHEDYQEIKGVKHHMDERELIAQILEEEDASTICGCNNRYFK